ncbi:MAG: hypothetical protein LBR97_04180 [Dysgonamonadaceae bacterium]|jgi:hypothetical protein|nr:hypothetical protein [Dysgonamonadaceae bacterium]
MGISEKIIHPDAFHVHLYKEGVFWIAYEQSAYYFWLKKGYKPTKKFVKSIKKEIVSIGFPQSALPSNINSNCLMEKDEINLKTFLLEESIDEDAFEQWKMQVPVYDALQAKESRIETALKEVLPNGIAAKIRDFPIAGKTPMECMLFLSEMQHELTNNSNGNLR